MTRDNIRTLLVGIALLVVFVVVPIIVYGQAEINTVDEAIIWNDKLTTIEFFHKIKAGVLLFILPVLLVLLGMNYIDLKKIKNNVADKFVYGYYLFVVISAFLSSYGAVNYFGVNGRYEGLLVITVYILLFMMSYMWIHDEEENFMMVLMVVGVSIVTLIGVPQYFGFDIFRTDIYKSIITPNNLGVSIDDIKFRVAANTIYSTLYNPNYLGSFYTLVIPALMGVYFKLKNKKLKIAVIVLTVLSVFALFGSRSSAGMTGLAVILLFSILLLMRKANKKVVLVVIVGLLLAVGVFNNGVMSFVKDYQKSFDKAAEERLLLETVRVDNNFLRFEFNDENKNFNIMLNAKGQMFFLDNDYQKFEYDYNVDNGRIVSKDDRFKFFTGSISKSRLDMRMLGSYMRFVITKDGWNILSAGNQIVSSATMADSMFFDGYERAGSGRGYIWSRTLPLLKDHIFIGGGPDSFVFEFPQDDIVGKINFMSNTYIIVDKPHNLYLQMAMNSGVISLILFLIAAGYFIVVGFYKIFKGYLHDPLAVGIYLSIVGYLATSFFNDSVVSIAPIFWIFFGYGMSKITKAKKLT